MQMHHFAARLPNWFARNCGHTFWPTTSFARSLPRQRTNTILNHVRISFKGAIQTLEAFQPVIALQGAHDAAHRLRLYHRLLDAIATHRVADRPDRYEPRA